MNETPCNKKKMFSLGERTDVTIVCGKLDGHVPKQHEVIDKIDGITITYRWMS